MSEEGEDLIARLEVLQAKFDAMAARPRAGAPDQRPRLHATPQGLQVLQETVTRLLASGELWWGEGQ